MHQRQWERAPDGTIRRVSSVRPGAADETASPPERYRPRVGRAIAASLRDLYDYLGSFLVASALFSLLLVSLFLGASQAATRLTGKAGGTGFLLPFVACLIPSLALLMGPFTAGLFRFAHCVAARQDPDLLDLTWGCHEAFGKSVRLALVQAVVAAILVVDFLFFAGWLGSGSHTAWPGALAIFFVYALAVWALMCLYQWALLAGQEAPVGAAVRKSALLLLDNPWFSLGLALVLALVGALLTVTMLGGLLLGAGFLATLATQGVRDLLRKYGLLPADPLETDAGADDAWGHGWHE